MKGPSQVSVVPLVEVHLREGKALGSEKLKWFRTPSKQNIKFRPLLLGNTLSPHYQPQPVNYVYGKKGCLQ
jgi:hypothetical protein